VTLPKRAPTFRPARLGPQCEFVTYQLVPLDTTVTRLFAPAPPPAPTFVGTVKASVPPVASVAQIPVTLHVVADVLIRLIVISRPVFAPAAGSVRVVFAVGLQSTT
jgi:hypothetical protein